MVSDFGSTATLPLPTATYRYYRYCGQAGKVRRRQVAGVTAGLVAGVTAGLAVGVTAGLVAGVTAGLAVGVTVGAGRAH